MRTRFVGLLAGAALAAATVVAVGAPAQGAPPLSAPPPTITWAACGGGFECATVDVPLDHGRPSLGTIALALIRLPASNPAQRIGSMFVNPGGPGGSGVSFVRNGARFFFSPDVRARFDVVGFDPRGVAGSTAIRCFTNGQEFSEFWEGIPAFPYLRSQQRPFIERTADYARLCGERNARMLPNMSTVDVARDMDLLRAAVGDDKLTYAGYSYGSYLGEVYANLFPDRVRALVLDGVLDPEEWADHTLLFAAEAARGGEQSLDAFSRECAAAGDGCAFADGDTAAQIRDRLDAILEGTRTSPMPAPNADPPGELDYSLANGTYLLSMYDTFFWPGFAQGLAAAEAGDGSILLDFIRQFLAPPGFYDGSSDWFPGVFCTDGSFPLDDDHWPAAVRLSELQAPTFSAYWLYSALPCASWPAHAPDRYSGPWNRRTSAPVLMISTLADPATPLSGAQRAQRRMHDARLLVLDGSGHTSIGQLSACVRQVMDRYLIDQVAPANNTHCAPDAGPFDVSLASASASSPAYQSPVPSLPVLRR